MEAFRRSVGKGAAPAKAGAGGNPAQLGTTPMRASATASRLLGHGQGPGAGGRICSVAQGGSRRDERVRPVSDRIPCLELFDCLFADIDRNLAAAGPRHMREPAQDPASVDQPLAANESAEAGVGPSPMK
jgi:hypothetical protein